MLMICPPFRRTETPLRYRTSIRYSVRLTFGCSMFPVALVRDLLLTQSGPMRTSGRQTGVVSFFHRRGVVTGICIKKRPAAWLKRKLLLQSNEGKFTHDWSPDGRFISYSTLPAEGGSALWVLPLFGDRRPIRFSESKVNAAYGSFAPNGRWLAYMSDESGTHELEVYVRPFPASAGVWQVSRGRRSAAVAARRKGIILHSPGWKIHGSRGDNTGHIPRGYPQGLSFRRGDGFKMERAATA